jgi:hypothetical protein
MTIFIPVLQLLLLQMWKNIVETAHSEHQKLPKRCRLSRTDDNGHGTVPHCIFPHCFAPTLGRD